MKYNFIPIFCARSHPDLNIKTDKISEIKKYLDKDAKSKNPTYFVSYTDIPKVGINPKFTYSPIKINAYELKQQLMKLPVNQIQDISIKTMYESVVNSYCDKIDIISTLDTPSEPVVVFSIFSTSDREPDTTLVRRSMPG